MLLGVSTSFEHTSAEEWVTKHKKLGLKSVVFPLNCDESEEKTDAYAKAAKENGLCIAEVGVWRNTLSGDPAERKEMTDYAVRQLAMADRIGAKCCVNVLGTPHGPRWDGGYAKNFSAETRKEAVRMIRDIIDEVKPRNTKYSIETMPWMVPTSPDDYLRLIEEVDRDGFGIHLDLVNMVNCPERYFFLDEFMDECLEKFGKDILSCHLKDILLLQDFTFQLKECACGEGILNLKRFINKLDSLRPDIPGIIEHLKSDEEYVKSVEYVQGLF